MLLVEPYYMLYIYKYYKKIKLKLHYIDLSEKVVKRILIYSNIPYLTLGLKIKMQVRMK